MRIQCILWQTDSTITPDLNICLWKFKVNFSNLTAGSIVKILVAHICILGIEGLNVCFVGSGFLSFNRVGSQHVIVEVGKTRPD